MKIINEDQIKGFLEAVNKCQGNVYLHSQLGDWYNLKSELSKYVAIAALLKDRYEELEVFCDFKQDDQYLMEFFNSFPEVL